MSEAWEVRRARLNHDWLAKIYASKLGAWRNVLNGLVRDDDFVTRFVHGDFAEWERRSPELAALIRDFSVEMSPRMLLTRQPLDRLDGATRAWVGDIVDGLWQARRNVPALVGQSRLRLEQADALYWPLKAALASSGSPAVKALQPEAARFVAFQKACFDLSEAVSLFPHEISIV